MTGFANSASLTGILTGTPNKRLAEKRIDVCLRRYTLQWLTFT